MVKIKLCGFTQAQDVEQAVSLGADAIGLNFYAPSKRYISRDQAAELARQIPPFCSAVGLFVNPDREFVVEALRQVPLNLLQFHGEEPPEFCSQFDAPYIKVHKVSTENTDAAAIATELRELSASYNLAKGFLIDTQVPGEPGGTGQSYNWKMMQAAIADCKSEGLFVNQVLIIAGGLTPSNVADCIACLQPYAVDVSSGIEASPGKKSAEKIRDFIANVRSVEYQSS